MLLSDNPIKTKKEDLLNRADFAEKLGAGLLSWKSETGIVIGLSGGWGMGKSSVINLATEYIDKRTKRLQDNNKAIIINFNPWNFAEQNQLITIFFTELAKAIKYYDARADAQKVGQKLITYSKFFSVLSLVPGLDPYAKVVGNVFKQVGVTTKEWGELKSQTVEQFKEDLDKAIKKINRKIIIVIDDIDRLNRTEIRQIFQLVKLNAKFPNTLYLLSFDQRKVINALGEEYSYDNDYLDKIIQVSFQVPPIEQIRLQKFLFEELDKVLKPLDAEKRWDITRWGNLYYGGMGEVFTSLRHVKRYINSLQFTISLLPKEINEIDFIGLEVIRVFAPDVYESIARNKELFTGTNSGHNSYQNNTEAKKKQIDDIVKKAKEKNRDSIKQIIRFLFPQMESIYGNMYYGSDWQSKWSKERRICATDRFDKYFFMALSEGEVSQQEMDMIIQNSGDLTKVEIYLRKLNKEKRIKRFLERLPEFMDEVPEDNMKSFILAVFNISDGLPREKNGMFDLGIQMLCIRIGYHILKRVEDENKRLAIIEDVIRETTSIDVPIQFVHLEKPKDGNNSASDSEGKRLVDARGYNKIKEIALDKLRAFIKSDKLASAPNLGYLLYALKEWGTDEETKQYIQKLIKTPTGVAKFIEGFMTQTSRQSMGDKVSITNWQIQLESFSPLIEIETVHKLVEKISLEQKQKLTARQKLALILFIEAYDKAQKKTEKDRVIITDALE